MRETAKGYKTKKNSRKENKTKKRKEKQGNAGKQHRDNNGNTMDTDQLIKSGLMPELDNLRPAENPAADCPECNDIQKRTQQQLKTISIDGDKGDHDERESRGESHTGRNSRDER